MTGTLENIRNKTVAAALAVLMAVSLGACSGGGSDEAGSDGSGPATSGAKPAAGATVYDPSAASGSVAGRVTFEGEAPPARTIRMAADPYCDKANEGGATWRPVEVGEGGGLAGVVVFVKKGAGDLTFSAADEPVVLDQQACGYRPRVVAVRTGQPIEIRNSDATLHNVHAMPKESKGFNLGMPREGMKSTRKFANPEVFVRIKCDVHPWMRASVAVVENPFFAVTDAGGRFEIDHLPAGTYTLEAAHPTLGTQTRDVVVAADGAAQAVFGFSK